MAPIDSRVISGSGVPGSAGGALTIGDGGFGDLETAKGGIFVLVVEIGDLAFAAGDFGVGIVAAEVVTGIGKVSESEAGASATGGHPGIGKIFGNCARELVPLRTGEAVLET